MEYKFYNKESKNEIKFETNSLYTFIYGPNGTGKTTFSRAYYDKKIDNIVYKVFNEDFINNNVYVTDMDGSKQSPENKKGLNRLFIGKNVKKYSDFLTRIRGRKNQLNSIPVSNDYKKTNDFLINKIDEIFGENDEYKKNKDPFIEHILKPEDVNNIIEKIKELIDIENITISTKNILNDKYTKKYNYDYQVNINNDLLKQEVIRYLKEKNKNQTEEYNKSINEFEIKIKNLLNVLSTNLLLQVEEIKKELEIEVKKYEIIKTIDDENKKFVQRLIEGKGVNYNEVEDWQREGYKFHKEIEFKTCLYCHNEDIQNNVKENYRALYENKYIKLLNSLKLIIEKYINDIINSKVKYDSIKNFYEKTDRKKEKLIIEDIYKNIDEIQKIINEIYTKKIFDDQIIEKIKVLLEYYDGVKEIFEKVEQEDEKKEEVKFDFNETLKLLYANIDIIRQVKKEIFLNNLTRIENKLKERINTIQRQEIEKVQTYLQFYQKIFNTKYSIENVRSTMSSAQEANAMLEIKFNNRRKINEISTGEKNILALIVFFSNLENELKKLKDNERITIILDDPVNSNDWNIFFSLQAIIEDYLQFSYKDKIENVIILSHNVDYAVIQLQNLKQKNEKVKLFRLFPDTCINIDIDLIYTSDIKLISNFIFEWLNSFEKNGNYYYMKLNESYRVFLSYRKFFEDLIYERSYISQVKIDGEEKGDIEKIKNISNNSDFIDLLDYSSKILYNLDDSEVNISLFTKKFINVIKIIISNENILKMENSDLTKILNEIEVDEATQFAIKGKETSNTIKANDFIIDGNNIDQEKMKNILVKAFTMKKDSRSSDEIKFMNNQSKTYYMNYIKHSNELVGKPLLALDVEPMIKYLNEE